MEKKWNRPGYIYFLFWKILLKGVGLVENRTAKCIFDGLGGERGEGGQQRPNLLRPCHAKYIKIRGLQKPSPRPS